MNQRLTEIITEDELGFLDEIAERFRVDYNPQFMWGGLGKETIFKAWRYGRESDLQLDDKLKVAVLATLQRIVFPPGKDDISLIEGRDEWIRFLRIFRRLYDTIDPTPFQNEPEWSLDVPQLYAGGACIIDRRGGYKHQTYFINESEKNLGVQNGADRSV